MTADKELYGVVAEFTDVTTLYRAAEKVRDAGYKKWDCHTPFPVHGLDDAMGIRFTRLPWVVLIMGITGLLSGMYLQYWTNAVDYAFDISGKPVWSLPANIPVIFEVTVLFSAFTAFFAMWIANRLPRWYHPLFRSDRFARATDDRFFIALHAKDKKFDLAAATALLKGAGAGEVEEVYEANEPSGMPSVIKGNLWVVACLMLIPPAMVYASYGSTTTQPRVHLIPDMDKQDRFRAQGETELFEDGRMTRDQVAGTIGQDQRFIHASLETGKENGEFVTSFPTQIEVTEAFIDRGQERFEIYCGICHGEDGKGSGVIHERAMELANLGQATWVPPTNVTVSLIANQTDGMLFETISEGRRTMPGYAAQIPAEDRWAIIAYLRVLQEVEVMNALSPEEMAALGAASRGEILFTQKICVGCHSLNGVALVGPPLNGFLDSEIKLDTGETIVADADYFKESILDPAAKIREGALKGLMVLAGDPLTDEEISDLLEYIKTQN
ncbi:MAG: DUF3341 domain-containing protein [Planctomycetota bacterium]|nr:DUF3341 domain-containing protein [Planctomycetota bacterium]MDA1113904.1 DUF3341 domain-containing protein [Planctomycetota bacterium]